jgi:alkyldihydroxyacetonephosphate synthase
MADAGDTAFASGLRESDSPLDRRMVAHDLWPRRLIERREGQPLTLPAKVLWPVDADAAALAVRRAREAGAHIVPFGAGSGVCAGIAPGADAWVVDTKRIDRLEWLDEGRGLCRVGAGMNGERLERALNARGFSLGHFPSSIYCSTVGGWVACRSAGQLSSRYGKIEDLVVALEGVDGRGQKIRADLHDPTTGPGALRLLIGSEGALCLFTHVELKVHRLATHRWMRGFSWADMASGLDAMRSLLQAGEAPSVLRLYDPLDSLLAGQLVEKADPDHIRAGGIAHAGLEESGPHDDEEEPSIFDRALEQIERVALFSRPGATRRLVGELLRRPIVANNLLDRWLGASKMVIGLEGDGDALGHRAPALRGRLIALGATDLGEGPGAKWLLNRHRVSYRMSHAFAAGGWVDTMEVALPWEGVEPLYNDVREALRDVAVVMCHFSHAYADGCSLYFTFAGGGAPGSGPRSARARYDLTWERALSTVRRSGAAISHHHGVGRSKVRALKRTDAEQRLLSELKAALDPDGLFNPGVIGLGGRGG